MISPLVPPPVPETQLDEQFDPPVPVCTVTLPPPLNTPAMDPAAVASMIKSAGSSSHVEAFTVTPPMDRACADVSTKPPRPPADDVSMRVPGETRSADAPALPMVTEPPPVASMVPLTPMAPSPASSTTRPLRRATLLAWMMPVVFMTLSITVPAARAVICTSPPSAASVPLLDSEGWSAGPVMAKDNSLSPKKSTAKVLLPPNTTLPRFAVMVPALSTVCPANTA